MKPKHVNEVLDFITTDLSIKEFYDFVTLHGTNCNYSMGMAGRNGYTPLHVACIRKNLPLMEALLEMRGINPNQVHGNNYPPLYDAIDADNLEAVKLLVKHGARWDYYVGITRSETCLDFALQKGNKDIIDYLKTISANSSMEPVNPIDLSFKERLGKMEYDVKSGLEDAVARNDLQMARNLLEDKTVIIGEPSYGLQHYCSPRVAAVNGNREMVELLTQYCDDLIEKDCVTASGRSIPHAARKAGHHDLAKFLEDTQKERYHRLKMAGIRQMKERKMAEAHEVASNPHSLFHKLIDKIHGKTHELPKNKESETNKEAGAEMDSLCH